MDPFAPPVPARPLAAHLVEALTVGPPSQVSEIMDRYHATYSVMLPPAERALRRVTAALLAGEVAGSLAPGELEVLAGELYATVCPSDITGEGVSSVHVFASIGPIRTGLSSCLPVFSAARSLQGAFEELHSAYVDGVFASHGPMASQLGVLLGRLVRTDAAWIFGVSMPHWWAKGPGAFVSSAANTVERAVACVTLAQRFEQVPGALDVFRTLCGDAVPRTLETFDGYASAALAAMSRES